MSVVWKYLPILKWKQGEQLALRHLTGSQWTGVTPLIQLPPIHSAPDAAALKVALPAYLAVVTAQIQKNIPEKSAVCIDTEYVSLGYQKQLSLLLSVCEHLHGSLKHKIIPVIPSQLVEALPALKSVRSAYLKSIDSVMVSFRTDQIKPAQVVPVISDISDFGVSRQKIHLLFDQYSIVGSDPTNCFSGIKTFLDEGKMAGCVSMTISGGSFPINLMGFPQGVTKITRVEWEVWKLLESAGDYSDIRYSDYAVTNPAPLPDIDPTQVNPSVAIRYAADRHWKLFKAKGFKKGPKHQYRDLCKLLMSDSVYSGSHFSYGDGQYSKAAAELVGDGNPSSWRKDATSHHIVLTTSSL